MILRSCISPCSFFWGGWLETHGRYQRLLRSSDCELPVAEEKMLHGSPHFHGDLIYGTHRPCDSSRRTRRYWRRRMP